MSENTTDYDLPEMWGRMSDEEKAEWFSEERNRRQAMRQSTTTGRRLRGDERPSRSNERLGTDRFRVDE